MGNSSYVRKGLCPGFVGSSGKSLGLKLRARLPLYSRPSENASSRKLRGQEKSRGCYRPRPSHKSSSSYK